MSLNIANSVIRIKYNYNFHIRYVQKLITKNKSTYENSNYNIKTVGQKMLFFKYF